jgi:phage terminase large subunit-like protein
VRSVNREVDIARHAPVARVDKSVAPPLRSDDSSNRSDGIVVVGEHDTNLHTMIETQIR